MDVHGRLSRHLLVDGYRLVLDLERSRGSRLVDARTGRSYLDFYTFFASAPLGVNPFDDDPAFLDRLGRIAANKPANPDLYTVHLADFTETFVRVLGDPELPHLFFVEGGALAVENALKCAFDWKSRRNEAQGRSPGLGARVLHLTRAFHGRSGYTLSLTNTDPVKTDRFPQFDWPRIDVPAIHLGDVEAAEERALAQARAAFERHPHDIACFIAEPIQGEGGDNHMRAEFLQAMERLCHEHDALFIVDEVQTGAGTTGTPWAHQQLGLRPDIVAFAKKVQVGGIMAGRRVDLVPDNVFRVSGRINSTWGGGLVDMVRSRRILEIIERDGLIARAGELGAELLATLQKIQAGFPELVGSARGRGLMCAFDLPDPAARDRLVTLLRQDEGVLVLPCGERSVRLRPALSITREELEEGTEAISRALTALRDAPSRA
ncbi:L-lysine 6-transaminase [Streptosporangium sandarakinum]|uniref:L-lysine-epsilon aminotransferase n=1 Tax=Streptosporangium sandarakinum TaxID=1260955 RepID=A0A852V7K4_9ACTN|nr:L-lysine 6-transaminase [Streptosporangium sandarakinum]NYF42025.1 L-lysine 6-transaminase [Streptosporangium sandarakinum]